MNFVIGQYLHDFLVTLENHRPPCVQFSLELVPRVQKKAHSDVCGLSQITRTLFLERDAAVV